MDPTRPASLWPHVSVHLPILKTEKWAAVLKGNWKILL